MSTTIAPGRTMISKLLIAKGVITVEEYEAAQHGVFPSAPQEDGAPPPPSTERAPEGAPEEVKP